MAALLLTGLLAACGHEEAQSPDLKYYDNGYGTYFVIGTKIEHPADPSTSTVVDWSGEPAAKASDDYNFIEKKGIIYKHGVRTDGREEGQPLDLPLNLMTGSDGDGPRPVIVLVPGGGFITCRIGGEIISRWISSGEKKRTSSISDSWRVIVPWYFRQR